MTMQTDVSAAHAEATGSMITGRYRLKGYQLLSGGTAGDIVFTDGGATGREILRVNISTNLAPIATLIPGEGILFTTSLYVTLPTDSKVTVFYG